MLFVHVGELQWGHGSEAVETSQSRSSLLADGKLQWGHGSEAVETAWMAVGKATEFIASMGPRL